MGGVPGVIRCSRRWIHSRRHGAPTRRNAAVFSRNHSTKAQSTKARTPRRRPVRSPAAGALTCHRRRRSRAWFSRNATWPHVQTASYAGCVAGMVSAVNAISNRPTVPETTYRAGSRRGCGAAKRASARRTPLRSSASRVLSQPCSTFSLDTRAFARSETGSSFLTDLLVSRYRPASALLPRCRAVRMALPEMRRIR